MYGDLNELTKRLLAEGYTREKPPEGYHAWRDFDGGWTYPSEELCKLVYETPCGLLVMGGHWSCGYMSFAGVDWKPENDNPTITCPYFTRESCDLVDERLRGFRDGIHECLRPCNCHPTDKPFDYALSYDKVGDDTQKRADAQFLIQAKGRRVCRLQARYNRTTEKWTYWYDPLSCQGFCSYCDVLDKPLDGKKGNVYYDVKVTYTVPGHGLIPDETKVLITRGKKAFKHPMPMPICEAAAKISKKNLEWREQGMRDNRRSQNLVEIIKIYAQSKEVRDLEQDLRDIEDGITVRHLSDDVKAAKQTKRERKKLRVESRNQRLRNKIEKHGLDGLDRIDRARAVKWLGEEAYEIEQKQEPEQMSLLEGIL